MLELTLKPTEYFNPTTNQFVVSENTVTVVFQHTLITVSKWESKWEVPFIGRVLTDEERIDYVGRCMPTNNPNLSPIEIVLRLTAEDTTRLSEFVKSKQSATVITRLGNKPKSDTITTEAIYYYMVQYNIPIAFEQWHLNRLITLLEYFSYKEEEKQGKGGKFKPTSEAIEARRQLNAQRLANMRRG